MEWAKNVQINIELLNHDLNIWDRKLEAAIEAYYIHSL